MFFFECWKILCELSPWLLLGMLLSGLMHVLLPKNFIRQKLTGTAGIFKAVGLGVPLPLCSCGVVPAGIGLKNQGASTGAAIGFIISTPQTGVDSILVSASFFGWPFAIFKMLTAAITGLIGGWLADRATKTESESESELGLPIETVIPPSRHSLPVIQPDTWPTPVLPTSPPKPLPVPLAIWLHGLDIIRSIWVWLVIGVFVSALIQTAIPDDWLASVGGWGLWPAMLVMLLISLPLYVCATSSIPIAAAIVQGGFPPAAALVFLMAGPATNITTIGAVYSRFGLRVLIVYLTTIIGGSLIFASLFDWLITATVVGSAVPEHVHDHQSWWAVGSAIVILMLIGYFISQRLIRLNHQEIT